MKMKEEQSINSLLSKDQSQEKKNKKLFESKKYIMFSFIFILLVILSIIVIFSILSSQKNNRELSEYNTNSIDIYNTNEKKVKSKEDELEDFDPISVILLVCYVIFIFLSLYIICQLRTLKVPTEEVQYKVIKFMYMSNNGYLVVSIIDTSISNMPTIVIGIDGISGLINFYSWNNNLYC